MMREFVWNNLGGSVNKLFSGIKKKFAGGSEKPVDKPDFSHVDSLEKAVALAKEGKLFRILLIPQEFGGSDSPENSIYVPPGIPEVKDQMTGTIIRFAEQGLIDSLNVSPEYKGESFVPASIRIETSHSDSDKEGKFNPTIEIW